jgi:hypothetical protein
MSGAKMPPRKKPATLKEVTAKKDAPVTRSYTKADGHLTKAEPENRTNRIVIPGTAYDPKAQDLPQDTPPAKPKRTKPPTLEDVVAKLKQHGIHFDHEE